MIVLAIDDNSGGARITLERYGFTFTELDPDQLFSDKVMLDWMETHRAHLEAKPAWNVGLENAEYPEGRKRLSDILAIALMNHNVEQLVIDALVKEIQRPEWRVKTEYGWHGESSTLRGAIRNVMQVCS